jgi:hypothetical protein
MDQIVAAGRVANWRVDPTSDYDEAAHRRVLEDRGRR